MRFKAVSSEKLLELINSGEVINDGGYEYSITGPSKFHYEFNNYLIDTKTRKVLGVDNSQPEDNTFFRHYSFVIELLNEIDQEKR